MRNSGYNYLYTRIAEATPNYKYEKNPTIQRARDRRPWELAFHKIIGYSAGRIETEGSGRICAS